MFIQIFLGAVDYSNSFNTQELRDSLKALLPNASINFAPTHPTLQHSRLRNNYMQPGAGAAHNGPSKNITLVHLAMRSSYDSRLDSCINITQYLVYKEEMLLMTVDHL